VAITPTTKKGEDVKFYPTHQIKTGSPFLAIKAVLDAANGGRIIHLPKDVVGDEKFHLSSMLRGVADREGTITHLQVAVDGVVMTVTVV